MSNAFFHKAELRNPLFLSFRELVRVRARTFVQKPREIVPARLIMSYL